MKNNTSTPIQGTERSSAESLLGLESMNSPDIVAAITRGLPFRSLEVLASRSDLSIKGLTLALGLHPAILARRRAQGKLTAAESDHLVSLANTLACVINFFSGDKEAAVKWFVTLSPALGNVTPLKMARTHTGCRTVETVLGRLAHGIF